MKKPMDLNKETAMRLWVKQFGKRQKATDFAGREMAKAAYNDRGSKYRWNVDHIFPVSKGGKTADYNLICCHMQTNSEKADRFPCFRANEKAFEIQKRQNHYEIVAKVDDQKAEEEEIVNFLDAAQGLKCWKQCRSDNKKVFAGYVKIKVEISNESDQLLERYGNFLIELFDTDSIFVEDSRAGCINAMNSYRLYGRSYNRTFIFTVMAGEIPTKEDVENLLDDCVILNTYSAYFLNKTGFESIQIACGMICYDSRFEMFMKCKKEILERQVTFIESLSVDELVKINTTAEKRLKDILSPNGWYPYNFIFTELKKNLEKYI